MSPQLSEPFFLFLIPPSIVSLPWLPPTVTNSTLRHNTLCQPASTSTHVPAKPPSSFLSSPPDIPSQTTIHLHLFSLYPACHRLLSPRLGLSAIPFVHAILPTLLRPTIPLSLLPSHIYLHALCVCMWVRERHWEHCSIRRSKGVWISHHKEKQNTLMCACILTKQW